MNLGFIYPSTVKYINFISTIHCIDNKARDREHKTKFVAKYIISAVSEIPSRDAQLWLVRKFELLIKDNKDTRINDICQKLKDPAIYAIDECPSLEEQDAIKSIKSLLSQTFSTFKKNLHPLTQSIWTEFENLTPSQIYNAIWDNQKAMVNSTPSTLNSRLSYNSDLEDKLNEIFKDLFIKLNMSSAYSDTKVRILELHEELSPYLSKEAINALSHSTSFDLVALLVYTLRFVGRFNNVDNPFEKYLNYLPLTAQIAYFFVAGCNIYENNIKYYQTKEQNYKYFNSINHENYRNLKLLKNCLNFFPIDFRLGTVAALINSTFIPLDPLILVKAITKEEIGLLFPRLKRCCTSSPIDSQYYINSNQIYQLTLRPYAHEEYFCETSYPQVRKLHIKECWFYDKNFPNFPHLHSLDITEFKNKLVLPKLEKLKELMTFECEEFPSGEGLENVEQLSCGNSNFKL